MPIDVNRMTYRDDDSGDIQVGYNIYSGLDNWYPTVWPDAEGRARYEREGDVLLAERAPSQDRENHLPVLALVVALYDGKDDAMDVLSDDYGVDEETVDALKAII